MASKYQEIEQREGRCMADILKERYEQYGNQTAVARSLSVSQGTVSLWLVRCGLAEKTVIVPRENEAVHA